MDNLKESKNSSSKTFPFVTKVSIMITLLTFSAAMNMSVVLAAEKRRGRV
jgi:hypothetical protein